MLIFNNYIFLKIAFFSQNFLLKIWFFKCSFYFDSLFIKLIYSSYHGYLAIFYDLLLGRTISSSSSFFFYRWSLLYYVLCKNILACTKSLFLFFFSFAGLSLDVESQFSCWTLLHLHFFLILWMLFDHPHDLEIISLYHELIYH